MSGIVPALLGFTGAALAALIGGYIAYRKLEPENRNTDANTTKTIVEASGTVIEQLQAEVARQTAVTSELSNGQSLLRLELTALNLHVEKLETIMRDAGLVPPPRPTIHKGKP